MAFATIVHFGYYGAKVIVRKGNEDEFLEYLKNWDMDSESEYDVYEEEPWGKFDKTYRKGNYILYWNEFVGYVGLCREL